MISFSPRIFLFLLAIIVSNIIVQPTQTTEVTPIAIGSLVCTTGIFAYAAVYKLIENAYTPTQYMYNVQMPEINYKKIVAHAYLASVITAWNACGVVAIVYGAHN